MAKGQTGKQQGTGKGKQKLLILNVGPSKRGRKTKKEVMENIFDLYAAGNPPQVCNTIQGWERESSHKEEDMEQQEATMDFISDPENIRGRLSLFHQSIHTYWILKCVLVKAMTSMQEMEGNPNVVSVLQEIKQKIQQIGYLSIMQWPELAELNASFKLCSK